MRNRFISKLIIILFSSFLLLSCHRQPVDPTVVRSSKYNESIKKVYDKLRIFYSTNFVPGMSVAVSINNQIVFADGFGYSNVEFKVRSSPAHKYRIGQVSELITALTAAKLSEEGKLPLDKPVYDLVPSISQANHDYTIRQLGAHSAGIREERAEAGKGSQHDPDAVVASFINDDLSYQPGTSFYHTELGFDLMGYLIGKTQNKAFYKVVKETLTDTLKLTSTMVDMPFRIIDEKAGNYDFDYLSQPLIAPEINLRGKEASAGYLSSVLDMVKMGNLLLYPGFLKQETLDMMTKPFELTEGKKSRYGFGVIVLKDKEGRTFYGQVGGVAGGCGALLIYPDDKLVVAIAANVQSKLLELPVFDVAIPFMEQLHPEMKAQDNKK